MTPFQYVFLMTALSVLSYIVSKEEDNEAVIGDRKEQAKAMLRKNVIMDRVNEIVNEKVKPSKKRQIEMLCQQAGYDIAFSEFAIISIGSALFSAMFFGFVFNNIVLGLIFLFLGAGIPRQILVFIKNKRLQVMDRQIGIFMNILTKRYESTDSFVVALRDTSDELKGQEPMSSEIDKTLAEVEISGDAEKALRNLAKRTDNKFLNRFAGYYGVVADSGDAKSRIDLLSQAYIQYEEDRQLNRKNKKEISEPVRILYLFTGAIPIVAFVQSRSNPDYIPFMTQHPIGKVGTIVIVLSMILVVWVANNKIGGPLD